MISSFGYICQLVLHVVRGDITLNTVQPQLVKCSSCSSLSPLSMHSDIYSKPEFLTKVRYRKNEHGDTAFWEVREEIIYDKPDNVADYSTDPPTQDGGE